MRLASSIGGKVQKSSSRPEPCRRKGRSYLDARNVPFVREHGTMACLREAALAKAGNAAGGFFQQAHLVIQSLKEVANEHPLLLKDPEPNVWLLSFGDSALNIQLLVWVDSPKIRRQVISDINCSIVRIFRDHNIEIPFPQRDIHVRTPSYTYPSSRERIRGRPRELATEVPM